MQQQVLNDIMSAGALVVTHSPSWQPTTAQIDAIVDRVGMVRMRLLLLDSFVDDLDTKFKKYRSVHTE